MYLGLHVECLIFLCDSYQTWMIKTDFLKHSPYKLHNNPSSGSRDVLCRQADRQTNMKKLTIISETLRTRLKRSRWGTTCTVELCKCCSWRCSKGHRQWLRSTVTGTAVTACNVTGTGSGSDCFNGNGHSSTVQLSSIVMAQKVNAFNSNGQRQWLRSTVMGQEVNAFNSNGQRRWLRSTVTGTSSGCIQH